MGEFVRRVADDHWLLVKPGIIVAYERGSVEAETLSCESYQASLGDLSVDGQPPFTAVSYVCGDQTPAAGIRCSSKTIGIPKKRV